MIWTFKLSHQLLDEAGITNMCDGLIMSLPGRIKVLVEQHARLQAEIGQLMAERADAQADRDIARHIIANARKRLNALRHYLSEHVYQELASALDLPGGEP